MTRTLRTALSYWAIMTFLLGAVYPSSVWFVGHFFFPHKAEGSLIRSNTSILGSSLIAQNFVGDSYFWPRPSATQPHPFNTLASGSSHLNPAHPKLSENLKQYIPMFSGSPSIPIDIVTSSASGLDPHISPKAAKLQIYRIAKARSTSPFLIEKLVDEITEGPTLGFLGEERVNVLHLNLRLDRI